MISAKPYDSPGQDAAAGERSDAQLMAAVARADAAAFRALVDRHTAALHRLTWRLMGEPSEAQDMVQETFIRLWTNAPGWRPDRGGLPAWLRRVATNLCLDRLRRRRFVSDADPPDRADDGPGAEAGLIAAGVADIAARAVCALPDRQRAAIVLTYYEELPNAVAAEAMQINLKAFESLLVRARATLRQCIADSGLRPADLGDVR